MGVSDQIFLFGTLFADRSQTNWPSCGRFLFTSKRYPQCVYAPSQCSVSTQTSLTCLAPTRLEARCPTVARCGWIVWILPDPGAGGLMSVYRSGTAGHRTRGEEKHETIFEILCLCMWRLFSSEPTMKSPPYQPVSCIALIKLQLLMVPVSQQSCCCPGAIRNHGGGPY